MLQRRQPGHGTRELKELTEEVHDAHPRHQRPAHRRDQTRGPTVEGRTDGQHEDRGRQESHVRHEDLTNEVGVTDGGRGCDTGTQTGERTDDDCSPQEDEDVGSQP